jgi:hypothetical protein
MIKFRDSLEFERCIDVSKSHNEKYINFTVYVPSKGVTGNTMQIPREAFKRLIELMQQVDG